MAEDLNAEKDRAYWERNQVVALLCKMALALGYLVWQERTDIEGWSPAWHNCVYIGLPTGQVSWHFHESDLETFAFVPEMDIPYDGHTTDEKYERVQGCDPVNQYRLEVLNLSLKIMALEIALEGD
jgi:hypothetical protein